MSINPKDLKILLVEHDPFLANVYATKFELEGFTVLQAADGEIGVSVAEEMLPDVILLDSVMPNMDGYEVLHQLKKHPTLRMIPVVMLTNLAGKEDLERCLKEGATACLAKAHVVPDEAVAKILKALEVNTQTP